MTSFGSSKNFSSNLPSKAFGYSVIATTSSSNAGSSSTSTLCVSSISRICFRICSLRSCWLRITLCLRKISKYPSTLSTSIGANPKSLCPKVCGLESTPNALRCRLEPPKNAQIFSIGRINPSLKLPQRILLPKCKLCKNSLKISGSRLVVSTPFWVWEKYSTSLPSLIALLTLSRSS